MLAARGGRLGYNVKVILETGEETGSPGLEAMCASEHDALAADVFLASDGPRVRASRPTMFLGSRGVFNFDLHVKLREGGHHSGNWGGLLRNPGVRLAHAIASLIDAHGRLLVTGCARHRFPRAFARRCRTSRSAAAPATPRSTPAGASRA